MKVPLNDRRLEIYREFTRGARIDEITEKYRISRISVWKFSKKLEELGYVVERGRKGYRTAEKPDPSPFDMALSVKEIPGIDEFYYFHEIDSTNRFAKENERCAVFAEKQTKGRGRVGRKWESDEGGIYFSISLNLNIPMTEIPKITLIGGLAVCKSLEKYHAKIKWPNDVLIDGKKVSGILSEFVGEELSSKIIMGVGINVRNRIPDYLKNSAISLIEIDPEIRITDVFDRLCKNLGIYLRMFPERWHKIFEEWKKLSDTIGKQVEVAVGNQKFEGIAVEIDEDGGLMVARDGKVVKVVSGECFYTNY